MDELGFWNKVVRAALHDPARGLCAWKIGTSTREGIPDVAWTAKWGAVGGWLELKYVREWPKRQDTPIRVETTAIQRAHLREWDEAGGRAYVLLGMPDLATGQPGRLGYLLPWDHDEAIHRDGLPDPIVMKTPNALLGALLAAHVPTRPG